MEWISVEKFLNSSTFICLAVTMIVYWLSIFFFNSTTLFKAGKFGSILCNILLVINLFGRWINAQYFPLSNLYESLLFLCWALLFGQILIEMKTNSKLLGTINLPIVLLLNSFASLTLPPEMQKIVPLVPSLQSNWLMMHVTMMMISYATLLLGSLFCLLYLILSNKKSKNLETQEGTKNNGLNSYFYANNLIINLDESKSSTKVVESIGSKSRYSLLEILDLWSYRIISLGFPFLSIGIISGAVWANEAWGSYWSWDPKETWALITWLVFAIYLHARLTRGWAGRKTAFVGSLGFFIIWICYLGVNFLGKGLHSYGWLS